MLKMMEVAAQNGAQATKIIGSGGGGCFVALTTKTKEQQLLNSLKKLEVKDVFTVQITSPSDG